MKYVNTLFNDLYIYRIDVNNSKDAKKGVFPCVEEYEVERSARSPKSACSCSPPESPNTSDPEKQAESPTNLNSFSGVFGVATKSWPHGLERWTYNLL